jgi:hypothetical protein
MQASVGDRIVVSGQRGLVRLASALRYHQDELLSRRSGKGMRRTDTAVWAATDLAGADEADRLAEPRGSAPPEGERIGAARRQLHGALLFRTRPAPFTFIGVHSTLLPVCLAHNGKLV